MPTSLTSYFAGVGTAGVAILVGFGGALVMSNVLSPHTPPAQTRVERVLKPSTQEIAARTDAQFPARADPVTGIPTLPVPGIMMSSTSGLSESHAASTPGTGTDAANPSNAPVVAQSEGRIEDSRKAPAVSQPAERIPVADTTAKPAEETPAAGHARRDAAVSSSKQRREIELQKVRSSARADQKRYSAREKREEITAAAEAVRRMLHERQDLAEDAMANSFTMNVSNY